MSDIYTELNRLRDLQKAKICARFFKTGKGEYGEGDKFLGISVPDIRKICKDYPVKNLSEIKKMLQNEFHEIRFAGLVCLCNLYEKADERQKKKIYDFYMKNLKYVNNWDLVDTSAPYIVGDYLLDKKEERKVLHKLSKSKNLWERRISVLATFPILKEGDFKDLEKISKRLLKDKEDLIHKAVGWMLREAGKKDEKFLFKFLDKYSKKMPRTMLRYSIEKLYPETRKKYLL